MTVGELLNELRQFPGHCPITLQDTGRGSVVITVYPDGEQRTDPEWRGHVSVFSADDPYEAIRGQVDKDDLPDEDAQEDQEDEQTDEDESEPQDEG